ncbi:GntR family transcriptional regulator [Zwartia sp.]|uniref:GntR family transcriptional regulator n=1 Tax=Zwartia sp. TaxID=2978004 RepID=UPI003BB17EC7
MTFFLTPMARENMAGTIYRQIKQRLMIGELLPGQTLTLRLLSESLGVSQTPVREALLQLVSERALAMTPGKSVQVPVLSREELQELRAVRLNLEVMAVENATPRITKTEIKKLVTLHKEMMRHKLNEDMAGTLAKNYEFHFALYQAANMPHLLAIIEGLWTQTGPSLTFLYRKPFIHLGKEHPHVQLIDALQRHDVKAAVSAIKLDVAGYGAALMERLPE